MSGAFSQPPFIVCFGAIFTARDEPERGWGKNYQNHIAKIQKATKVPSPRGARCAEIPRRLVFVLVRIGGNKVTFPLSFFLDFDMF